MASITVFTKQSRRAESEAPIEPPWQIMPPNHLSSRVLPSQPHSVTPGSDLRARDKDTQPTEPPGRDTTRVIPVPCVPLSAIRAHTAFRRTFQAVIRSNSPIVAI